jgi:uncharacterized DUF497 family protein
MFETADWSKRADHIAKHGVTPQQANEALADTARVVIDPDPAQKPGGRGVRIIGWSDTAARILTAIVVEHDGIVYGATAFKSNETDQNRYEGSE